MLDVTRVVLVLGALCAGALSVAGCESSDVAATEDSEGNVGATDGGSPRDDDGKKPENKPVDGDEPDDTNPVKPGESDPPDEDEDDRELPEADFVLQLLHAADMEAGAAAVQDAPRFSAVLDSLRNTYPTQTLTLSSGDTWIPGPFFSVSSDKTLAAGLGIPKAGRTDVLMLNAMGFQASAIGNHELDLGPASVASLIAPEVISGMEGMPDAMYPGASFPYLSANLVFGSSVALGPLFVPELKLASELAGKLASSTLIEVGGETVGIVAATTPTLRAISSPGDLGVLPADPSDLDALAEIIQAQVDAITARGIDKIVLLAHMQQIALEQALAGKLRDVDIIVAGGSNTLLADETDRLRTGDTAAGPYPLMLRTLSDEPVALVNTDGNYRYLGRLVVGFDAAGILLESTIRPEESGAYATDEAGVMALAAVPNARVAELADNLGDALNARDGNLFGASKVFLEGRRGQVRTEETNLGNLTADANLFVAQQYDPTVRVSIKNGGGIRAEIGVVTFPAGSTNTDDLVYLPSAENPAVGKQEGDISQFDIENALSFNNSLSIVTLTAEELERLLEHGVAGAAPGSTPGQFFQLGGLRVSFDPSEQAQKLDVNRQVTAEGNRIRNAAIVDDEGKVLDALVRDGLLVGEPTRLIRIVTLSFLADGGDAYPFPEGGGISRVNLTEALTEPLNATFAAPGTEQDALAELLIEQTSRENPFSQADTKAALDQRIQNLAFSRVDSVFPASP